MHLYKKFEKKVAYYKKESFVPFSDIIVFERSLYSLVEEWSKSLDWIIKEKGYMELINYIEGSFFLEVVEKAKYQKRKTLFNIDIYLISKDNKKKKILNVSQVEIKNNNSIKIFTELIFKSPDEKFSAYLYKSPYIFFKILPNS